MSDVRMELSIFRLYKVSGQYSYLILDTTKNIIYLAVGFLPS